MTRYCLIQDDDSHWYVCPADRVEEAQAAFAAVAAYWGAREYVGEAPDVPDWCQPVGGAPSLVTFTDPVIA